MASELHTLYPFSGCGWDFHSFNANTTTPLAMDQSPFSSPASDSSTGYLQDAIAQWTHRCKRQRVSITEPDNLVQNNWNWNFEGDPFANDRCWTENAAFFSGDPLSYSLTGFSTGATLSMSMKTKAQDHETTSENERLSSSPSSYKHSMTDDPDGKDSPVSRDPLSSSERHCRKRKMITGRRVAYPFAVVKPGGAEGDVTLEEINERILMRPTRPVRHPVGEFASHPCVSAHGPGLSGKAVVALTRIHTQGRGTVTIIRTRG